MLDLKDLRACPDFYVAGLQRKGVAGQNLIPKLLEQDQRYRTALQELESLSAEQNKASQLIPQLSAEKKEPALQQLKELSNAKKKAEKQAQAAQKARDEIWHALPNLPDKEAPDGRTDQDNVVLKKVGKIREFDFTPLEHWELAERLDLLDTERSAKVSGARFYYLKNQLAILQQALMMWGFQQVAKKGFTPIIPPFMTRKEAIFGTGFLDHDQNYIVNPEDEALYLIGTSEVPVTSYFSQETLNEKDLPKKFVAYSPCFRREAGTYGKDMKGIFRVHQFEKIEMVIFCSPQDSVKMHEQLREVEEELLQALEIPYQLVNVCCGDLGNSATKKYDLEAWLPGQKAYREMTSTSICTDWQTRRIGTRIKMSDGSTVHAHTLNGTAVSSRPLVAILENGQQADGSIEIPEVLRPWCGFDKIG